MGGLFRNGVSRTGVGNDIESAEYFDTPQQALSEANRQLASTGYGAPTVSLESAPAGVIPGADGEAPIVAGGTGLAFQQPKAPGKVVKPSFREAVTDRDGNFSGSNPGATKLGNLLGMLFGAAEGGASGAGLPLFAQGFRASGANRAEMADTGQRQRVGRLQERKLQQDIDLQPLYLRKAQSEIAENEARTRYYGEQGLAARALAGKRDQSQTDLIAEKKQLAADGGLKPGTPEYNQFVYGVSTRQTSDSKPGVDQILLYGDPRSPEYKRAAQLNAERHRPPQSAKADDFKKKVTNYSAALIAQHKTVDKAIEAIQGAIKSGQLNDDDMAVASQALVDLTVKLPPDRAMFIGSN